MPQEEPELIGEVVDVELIAVNTAIRELSRLRKQYGGLRWRKLKGRAYVIREGRPILRKSIGMRVLALADVK